MPDSKKNNESYKRKILEALAIYGLATLLASGLWAFHIRAENIIMLYLISIIVMIIEIQEFAWSAAYMVLCILSFNFLFTEPRLTLRVNDPNYIVTMGIFMAVSAITALLVSRLGEQVKISRRNENRMEALLEISSGYLTLSGLENIVYYCIKSLYQAAGERCVVYIADSTEELGKPYYIKSHFPDPALLDNDTPAHWCYINNAVCGANTGFFGNSGWVYIPIKNRDKCLGVMGVYTDGQEIDNSHMVFINTVLSEMGMAVEKERISRKTAGQDKEEQGNETLSRLRRSLYMDFCKPFQEIADSMEEVAGREGEETAGLKLRIRALHNRIGNMAQLCDMENGGIKASVRKVDFMEIICLALSYYKDAGGNRIVWMKRPEGPLYVMADEELMRQAVSNIVDNALLYTPCQCQIYVSLTADQGYGVFEIADRGSGISIQDLQKRMAGGGVKKGDVAGSGLIVTREIAKANRGSLAVQKSSFGGTSIIISVPEAAGEL